MTDQANGDSDAKKEKNTSMDLPGNSYTNRKKDKVEEVEIVEKKKVEKVVAGEVIQRKKGFGHKVRETFSGDDAQSVWNHIFFDVIIPATKSMIVDATNQGIERLLFGDVRSRSKVRSSSGRSGYSSYSKMYKSDDGKNSRSMSHRGRATHDFDEIILGERGEAEEVLDQLTALIEDYNVAKISDLYELVGITPSYTDDKWGWTDLRGASTSRHRQGYLLDLPRPIALD